MAGKRDRFLADAFHQVAVGGEHVGRVIDELAAEARRRDGVRRSPCRRHWQVPGRAGRWWFRRRRVAVFGMAGREGAELAETLDLVDRHLLVAEKIKERVEQHRAVAGRQHEAVAVGPRRIGRIEFEEAGEQHGRDIGRAHRQAGMAGLGLSRPHPSPVRGWRWPCGRGPCAPWHRACGAGDFGVR